MFPVEERCAMIEEVLSKLESGAARLSVDSFSGLTVDFAGQKQATAIVRGIRTISDYEYERPMALMNRRLAPGIETVFLMAADEFSYVSSNLIKQVFNFGGPIEGLVPALIEEKMKEKIFRLITNTE